MPSADKARFTYNEHKLKNELYGYRIVWILTILVQFTKILHKIVKTF